MSKKAPDNNSDTTEDTKPVSSEFKDLVVTWVEIDDKIRKLNAQLKEFKDEKKDYEQSVVAPEACFCILYLNAYILACYQCCYYYHCYCFTSP